MADAGAISPRIQPNERTDPGAAVERPATAVTAEDRPPTTVRDVHDRSDRVRAPAVVQGDPIIEGLTPATGQVVRQRAAVDSLPLIRIVPIGDQVPVSVGDLTPGRARVTPEVAGAIIQNIAEGQPGFRPDAGKGGASWFLVEGMPHTGIDRAKNVSLDVDVRQPANRLVFREAQLQAIFDRIAASTDRVDAEARYRAYRAQTGNPVPEGPLNSRNRDGFARYLSQRTESAMWTEVGRQVSEHPSRAGEVVLENSRFSRQGNGRFFVTSDATHVRVRGGVPAVMDALKAAGHSAEPGVLEAAERLASRQAANARVQGAFRIGGRVLLVVGAGIDTYRIITATDRPRVVTEVAGGWAGAIGAAAAFSAWYVPADAAGPLAWVGHGLGVLAAGAFGYWAGSTATRTVYDLVVDPPR